MARTLEESKVQNVRTFGYLLGKRQKETRFERLTWHAARIVNELIHSMQKREAYIRYEVRFRMTLCIAIKLYNLPS